MADKFSMMVPIATISDIPNKNGRIYLRDSFNQLPEKVPVELGIRDFGLQEEEIRPEPVGEASGFKFEGNKLMADVKVNEAIVALLASGVSPGFSFVMNGVGNLNDKKVTNFDMEYVAVLPADQSAFVGMD